MNASNERARISGKKKSRNIIGKGNENMAIYRNIQMSFWTDPDVIDNYTADDRYFYLYLMTNPHTNLCGCYEISMKQIKNETKIKSMKKIEELMDRMANLHKNILYSKGTKEILIIRWYKYNWTSSEKFRKPLLREIQKVKNPDFKSYLMALFNGDDTVSPYKEYGIDTTVTVSDTDTDSDTDTVKVIIDYLNNKLGSKYRYNTPNTQRRIKARLNDGYSECDFFNVIDKKYDEWHGTDMEKYLCPDTLFGSKFEKYLNQKVSKKNDVFNDWGNA